jgi:hypothetical protein
MAHAGKTLFLLSGWSMNSSLRAQQRNRYPASTRKHLRYVRTLFYDRPRRLSTNGFERKKKPCVYAECVYRFANPLAQ